MSFQSFCDTVQSPALKAVALHWAATRASRQMPAWKDLQPSRIAAHLGLVWAFRYDRSTTEFTGRLASNRITEGFGMSFRGRPLRELHPPGTFPYVHRCMSRVVLEPVLYHYAGPLFRHSDRIVSGERIMLPLAANGVEGDGILGASDYHLPNSGFEKTPVELLSEKEDWFSVTTTSCPAA